MSSEGTISQVALAPPAEISVPRTPTPSSVALPDLPMIDAVNNSQIVPPEKSSFVSPAPPSSSEMTPPPSTQVPPNLSPPIRQAISDTTVFPASPPATVKQSTNATLTNLKQLPSPEDVLGASESELRNMVNDLIGTVQEARMSAAHFRLQHGLLAIESAESAKRAEIEHEMTKREVEVMQSAEFRNRSVAGTPRTQPSPHPQLELVLKHCNEVENANATLDRRLRRAKRLIGDEQDKLENLTEENARLKKRIKENRDHVSRMRANGNLSTPRTEFLTPQRKAAPRFLDGARSTASSRVGGQDPFAALLAADQVLSGEPASVPSTPTRSRPMKLHPGHTRGTHSLSSLPTTPSRSRPVTTDNTFFTPVNRSGVDNRLSFSAPVSQVKIGSPESTRHDRDSTISVSDNEEAVTDEEIPQSQASSLATSMLRRNPGSQEEPSASASVNTSKSSTMLQSKLFGQVKKMGVERSGGQKKRHASFGEADMAVKKSKLGEGVGLGIVS